jgi:hypothetical protein
MSDALRPTWRELALSWKAWAVLVLCLLIAAAAALLGYD